MFRTVEQIAAEVREDDRLLVRRAGNNRGTLPFIRERYGFGPVLAQGVVDYIRQP